MAVTSAIIGIAATLASTGYGIYSSEQAKSAASDQAKKNREAMLAGQASQQQNALKTLLPGAKADAAARTGGGISPEFLQGVVGNELGLPTGGLGQDALSQIAASLGPAGGGNPLGGGIQSP